MFKIINKQFGFSILEIMIAMSIMSVGLLGVSSLVIQNLQVQNINRNYLTAAMLAQEGLELVRNQRDTNWLKRGEGYDWLTGDPGGDDNTNILHFANEYSYTIDVSVSPIVKTVNSINVPEAKLWILNDFYVHSNGSGISTPFSRLIRVLPGPGNDYITASSTVQWMDSGRVNTYVAETQLFNWR